MTTRKIPYVNAFLALIVTLATGCDARNAFDVQLPDGTEIDLAAGFAINDGTTQQLDVTVRDRSGNPMDVDLSWRTSDPSIASVSQDGAVTGERPGEAVITASAGYTTASTTVTVRKVPVALEYRAGSGQEGPEFAPLEEPLSVQLVDRRGNPVEGVQVEFVVVDGGGSAQPAIVTTDQNGVASTTWVVGASGSQEIRSVAHPPEHVRVIAEDEVTFEATAVDNGGEPAPGTIQITTTADTFAVGSSVQLQAVARDASGVEIDDAVIVWSTSNADIATVNSTGMLLARAAGIVTITASSTCCSSDANSFVIAPPAEAEVSDVIVNPNELELAVGSIQTIAAQVLDASGNPLDEGVTWRTTSSGIATVNSSGRVTGMSAGEAGIIATSGGHSDTAWVTVVAAPPPGEYNEPAGFTPIVIRGFNSKASQDSDRGSGSLPNRTGGSEGWDGIEYRYGNLDIVSAPGDPLSPGSAMRFTYPAGQDQNSGPGVAQTQGLGDYRQLYVRTSLRLGPTYYVGNVSNKLYFHRMNGSPRGEPFIALHDTNDPSRFRLAVNFQGTPDNGRGFIYATGAGASIQREQWYTIETLLISSSQPGASDGIFRLWLNGELVINVTDVDMRHSGTDGTWSTLHVSPTYGGDGRPNENEFYFDLGHAYVSGRN